MQRETYKSDDNSKTNCRTLNKHVHPRSVRYCKKGLCAVSVYITTIQPQTQPHGVIRERVERRAVLFLPLHRAAWPNRERAVSSQTTSARVSPETLGHSPLSCAVRYVALPSAATRREPENSEKNPTFNVSTQISSNSRPASILSHQYHILIRARPDRRPGRDPPPWGPGSCTPRGAAGSGPGGGLRNQRSSCSPNGSGRPPSHPHSPRRE